ncbi:hypothetical protein ACQZV8_13280 [Magnetococcales bacterium HHB-1]
MGTPIPFRVQNGLDIGTHLITGGGAPGGTSQTDNAPQTSVYFDTVNGLMYTKKYAGSGTDKWVQNTDSETLQAAVQSMPWRDPAKVFDSTSYANLAAAETAVNSGTIDGESVSEGDRILFTGITGANKNVFIITGTVGADATLTEDPDNTATQGDVIYIGSGTSAGRRYHFNSIDWVQIGAAERDELGFLRSFVGKTGEGSETPTYVSTHVVTDGDTLETGISKLDAEIGSAVTSTAHVSSTATVNENISTLDDLLSRTRVEATANSVTTQTVVDTVSVDDVAAVEYTIHARHVATPSRVQTSKVLVAHDGTAAADATDIDFSQFGILELGAAIPGLTVDIDLNGTDTSQVMRLNVSSSEAVNVTVNRTVIA